MTYAGFYAGRLLRGAVLASLFLLASGTHALAQVGGAAVVFLQIEPDARAAGMGNASVAIADNASAIFWNPAGLAFQRGTEASITHSQWLPKLNADLFYDYLVGKHHVEGLGTFGGHVTFLNLGEHEWRDEKGNFLGTFRSYDLAAGLSWGTQVTENFALGTSARFIYSSLTGGQDFSPSGGSDTQPGVSVGVDLAGLYRSNPISMGGTDATLSAGFNLANLGPKVKYVADSNGDPIPTNLRFGYAVEFEFDEYNSITFANDFTKVLVDRDSSDVKPFYQAVFSAWKPLYVDITDNGEDDGETLSVFNQLVIGAGAEYWYRDLFAFRAGYFYENPYNGNREFLTLGAGIRYNIIGVDFSYIYPLEEASPLSDTMRFSLLLDING